MKIFISKYRRRIDIRLSELRIEREAAFKKKDSCSLTLAPSDYVHWSVTAAEIQNKIDLLESLLVDDVKPQKK